MDPYTGFSPMRQWREGQLARNPDENLIRTEAGHARRHAVLAMRRRGVPAPLVAFVDFHQCYSGRIIYPGDDGRVVAGR